MGARGGTSVVGGNWKIFNEMILASGAKLHLNTPVLSIEQVHTKGEERVTWKVGYSEDVDGGLSTYQENIFDAVVIASPFVPSLGFTADGIATILHHNHPASPHSNHRCRVHDVTCHSPRHKSSTQLRLIQSFRRYLSNNSHDHAPSQLSGHSNLQLHLPPLSSTHRPISVENILSASVY
jgi:Prenylcysteine lyase